MVPADLSKFLYFPSGLFNTWSFGFLSANFHDGKWKDAAGLLGGSKLARLWSLIDEPVGVLSILNTTQKKFPSDLLVLCDHRVGRIGRGCDWIVPHFKVQFSLRYLNLELPGLYLMESIVANRGVHRKILDLKETYRKPTFLKQLRFRHEPRIPMNFAPLGVYKPWHVAHELFFLSKISFQFRDTMLEWPYDSPLLQLAVAVRDLPRPKGPLRLFREYRRGLKRDCYFEALKEEKNLPNPGGLLGGGRTGKKQEKNKGIHVKRKDGTEFNFSYDRNNEQLVQEIEAPNTFERMKNKKHRAKRKDDRRTDHDRHKHRRDGKSQDNLQFEKVKVKSKLSDPKPILPVSKKNKKQLPEINVDSDSDDEEEDFQLPNYRDWETFTYHVVELWFYIIKLKRKRTASLPAEWIRILDEDYLSAVKNSVNYTTFCYKYTSDNYYKSFRKAAKARGLYDLVALFEKNTERYFFAFEAQKAKNKLELGEGNSKYYAMRRTTTNSLNKEVTFWKVGQFLVFSLAALTATVVLGYQSYRLARYVDSKTRSAYGGVVSACGYVGSFTASMLNSLYTPFEYGQWLLSTPVLPENPVQQHTLITTFPRFSLYLEEIVKICPGGWWLISALERLKYGNWNTYKWHKKSSKWKFWDRVAQHKKINRAFQVNNGVSHEHEYRVFLHNYNWKVFTDGVFHLDERVLPTAWIPWMSKDESVQIMDNFNIGHLEARTVPLSEKESYFYPLMWFMSPMVVPRNTYEIRWAAAVGRVVKYPNSKISDPALYATFKNVMLELRVDHIEIPDWEEQLDARQKKNIKEARENREKEIRFDNIKCQVKCDEGIFAISKMVPRLITNQSGEEFLAMGKQTSEISKWVHEVLFSLEADKPIILEGIPYYFYFVAGSTSSDLDAWMKRSIESGAGVWTLVMGDDSYSYVIEESSVYWLENDFSAYDRTQHFLLRKCVDKMLKLSGYEELVRFRKAMYGKSLKFDKEKDGKKSPPVVDIYGVPADMRYTGEAATCLDNSLINIVAFAVCHSQSGFSDQILEQNFLKLGLKSKIKRHYFVQHGTFLRGSFLPNIDGGYTWTRLPSFLLKFGKVLTDPHRILPQSIPYHNKCASIMLGQWLSYGDMTNNILYETLDFEIRRITDGVTPVDVKLDFWQIPMEKSTYVTKDVIYDWIMNRYKIEVDELLDALEILRDVKVTDLPVTWHDQRFDVLLVDYI